MGRLAIADVTVANYVFYSMVAEKTFGSEVFASVVDDVLEAGEGYRDVVFVGFSFLCNGFCDALTEGPERGELGWRLGHYAVGDERVVCSHERLQKIGEFLRRRMSKRGMR